MKLSVAGPIQDCFKYVWKEDLRTFTKDEPTFAL
jgi:hypothetical protein